MTVHETSTRESPEIAFQEQWVVPWLRRLRCKQQPSSFHGTGAAGCVLVTAIGEASQERLESG
jgi:hypothetical protein